MATTVVMVVSSPHRPKLAPKPSPAKQLDAVSPQPPPLRSPLSRQEFFGPRETQNVVPASDDNKRPDSVHHHRCVNQTSTCAECRNADPSPVNIDSVILRRGRRTKAPKPLPYLEPIVTYLARSDRQPAVNGRPGVAQQRRRKRVTFAAPSSTRSLKSRQRRVARTHSEKLSLGRRRELAYLVVDLQSGSIASCSDEQSESTTKSLRGGASLQKSVTVSDPHARERAMSTGADGSRPVPLPRRIKKVASPAEKDCTTPEHLPSNEEGEKSVTSPVPPPRSPARKPTPEGEVVEESPSSPQTPSTPDSSRSSRSESIVFQRRMTFEGRETSPRPRSLSTTTQSNSKPPPPPPLRTSSVLTYSVPQSKPVVSDSQPSHPSTPPTLPPKSPPHTPPSDPDSAPPPPPLPAKSELSRRIQSSIRQRRDPPTPPQPYETPDPLELTDRLETRENYSYGSTILSDGSSGGYEVSDPNVDLEKDNPEDMYIDPTLSKSDPTVNMEEDKPEDIYIDPTQSKQFSSSGKPRPPRPPPPSSRAVIKAKQKKAQSLASSAVALRSRQLTKQRSCSAAPNTSTNQQQKSQSPLGSSHSTSTCSKPAEDADEILYEELDTWDSAPQASILWRPPSATNSSQSVVAPSRGAVVDPVGATPSLPPRAQKPATAHRVHRSNDLGTKNSTPGKVERSISIGDLNTSRSSSRQASPCISSKQDNSGDLELDSADEYEPLDDSVPVAPQRTRKKIKGTTISPNRAPGNIYNPNAPQSGKRTSPVPRRPAPVAPPGLRKRGEQRNKSPQIIKSSVGSRKSTGGGGKGTPGKQSCKNLQDEGGVEEYVDMDYKPAADGEDGPDVYVDMQPNDKVADTQEDDDGVSLRPYVRT